MEDKLWQQYLVDYSVMNKDNFTSFEDYKKKAFGNQQKVKEIDVAQILKKAEAIKNLDQHGSQHGSQV